MSKKPAQTLMRLARAACEAIAEGPFTPIILERYEFIGGERGTLLGHESLTATGSRCMIWTPKQDMRRAAA
jgi:hypothetical protein